MARNLGGVAAGPPYLGCREQIPDSVVYFGIDWAERPLRAASNGSGTLSNDFPSGRLLEDSGGPESENWVLPKKAS